MKFVFFVKSRLIFNAFYCFTMFVYKHFTNITRKFLRPKMRKFHLNMCSFEYIFISVSICIHLNIYSFECIERFSNFYLRICDKDLRHSLSFEENQEYEKSCNIYCKYVKIFFCKNGFLTPRFLPRLNRC